MALEVHSLSCLFIPDVAPFAVLFRDGDFHSGSGRSVLRHRMVIEGQRDAGNGGSH
jgi:hypothetical protein